MTNNTATKTREQIETFLQAERETLKRLRALQINCFSISESSDFKPTPNPPLFHTAGGSYPCPDIIAFEKQKAFFVEVKHRNKKIFYNGAEELAINENYYLKYCEVEKATGAPVWLAFYCPDETAKPERANIYLIKINDHPRKWNGTNAKTGEKITNTRAFYMYDLRHAKRLILPQKDIIKTFI